jgi:hypothetical protein
MFGRLSRMTLNGALSCYFEATWGGRSSQGQVSLVSLMTQGGRRAHGRTIQSEQPPKGGLSPVTEYAPGTGGRDSAAAFRPLSSCCLGSWALYMSYPTLSVSAIVLSLSTGACWSPPSPCAGGWAGLALVHGVSPTGVPGPSCCCRCAPGGAVNMRASRSGAPV